VIVNNSTNIKQKEPPLTNQPNGTFFYALLL